MPELLVDTDPKDRLGWRWRMHHNMLVMGGALMLMGSAMFIGLPMLGQVAWAEAQDRKTDEKIQHAVQPINSKLAELGTQQDTTSRLLLQKLVADLDEKIVQTTILKCKAKTEDSAVYFRQRVQEFIDQYNDLTKRYDKRAPSCSDIQ